MIKITQNQKLAHVAVSVGAPYVVRGRQLVRICMTTTPDGGEPVTRDTIVFKRTASRVVRMLRDGLIPADQLAAA